jgi:hypothetical protein
MFVGFVAIDEDNKMNPFARRPRTAKNPEIAGRNPENGAG